MKAVADVRSKPYSRRFPQFNREGLRYSLEKAGLSYVFFGEELGGRTDAKEFYENRRLLYTRLGRSSRFQEGLTRLRAGMERYRIAMLCAEKDPLMCHRGILVARQLAALGNEVVHILDRDIVEHHSDAVARLLRLLRLETNQLFRTADEVIDMAYELQGERIAYEMQEECSRDLDNRSS